MLAVSPKRSTRSSAWPSPDLGHGGVGDAAGPQVVSAHQEVGHGAIIPAGAALAQMVAVWEARPVSYTARLAALGAVLLVSLLAVPPAFAAGQPGVQRLSYRAGPYHVGPGQNRILFSPKVQKPQVDGYIVGIRPNLRHADGSIPRTNRIMFHHGVWLNMAGKDPAGRGPERFFAAGEEKTNLSLPKGYGYAYKASDPWLLNYMIHNLVSRADDVYITYDIDFIPATSPAAAAIKPARPVWMDVENGKLYPVFDV